MLTTISRLVRPPMAILALWATIYMFTTSAALAQALSGANTERSICSRERRAVPAHRGVGRLSNTEPLRCKEPTLDGA